MDSYLPAIKVAEVCHGFDVLDVCDIPELRSRAILARHCRTGVSVFHLLNDDEENLFAIAFRTFPSDNTGVAHILEHAVLGGSRSYPVRDPFLEMLKSSMATYINAITHADRTVYPVASNVTLDYFNLVKVYFDAVFHPNITEETLRQEGHHLVPGTTSDGRAELTIRGIVYNEMKGAFSDPDTLFESAEACRLFPDTPYAFESGGLPDEIPDLTYEAFRRFYETNYAPGNARIFLYGNIPTSVQLSFLDELLSAVQMSAPRPFEPPCQPAWKTPRREIVHIPLGDGEDPCEQGIVSLSWSLGAVQDPMEDLALETIDRLLVGDAASPLRRALIDSRLGDDLSFSGYQCDNYLSSFHVGLRGIDPGCADAMVNLVMATLEDVCREGFPVARVEATFRQMHFDHCEIQSQYPLALMEDVFSAWLYDRNPATHLQLRLHLSQLKSRWEKDPDIFIRLIKERLLENPHCLTLVGQPVSGFVEQQEETTARWLAAMKERLSDREIEEIAVAAQHLEKVQNTPNSPDALAKLPRLGREDIPNCPALIPSRHQLITDDCTLLKNDIDTNGIDYVVLGYDLSTLPVHLLEMVPVYADLFSRLGTTGCPYTVMAERISGYTGGIEAVPMVGRHVQSGEIRRFLSVGLKSLTTTFSVAWEILTEILWELDCDDVRRLRDVLQQRKSAIFASLVPNGHQFAMLQAARGLSDIAFTRWLWRGLPQLHLSEQCVSTETGVSDRVVSQLSELRDFFASSRPSFVSCTGSTTLPDQLAGRLAMFPASVRRQDSTGGWGMTAPGGNGFSVGLEGIPISSEVAFCAAAMPAYSHCDSLCVPLEVASQILSYDYLWEEIRVKGGAYGGSCRHDIVSGILGITSYRDPSPENTFAVIKGVSNYLQNREWSDDTVTQAAIACAKNDQHPVRPEDGTTASLWRYVCGADDTWRVERRRQLLAVTPDAVRQVLSDTLSRAANSTKKCVLASDSQLQVLSKSEPGGVTRISSHCQG